jgi:hypothetical protein
MNLVPIIEMIFQWKARRSNPNFDVHPIPILTQASSASNAGEQAIKSRRKQADHFHSGDSSGNSSNLPSCNACSTGFFTSTTPICFSLPDTD